jgi:hypothetical protein
LNESKAHEIEIERIAFWKSLGVNLTNITFGGEGITGLKHKPSSIAKITLALKKRAPISENTRAKLREAGKKHTISVEGRARISKAHKGRHISAKSLAKHIGRIVSEETKAKMSAASKRRWKHATDQQKQEHKEAVKKALSNPETREKLKKAMQKIGSTPEYREKMRIAQLQRFTNPDERLKLSKSRLGHKHSDITKAKLSNAAKKQWELVKARG